MSDECITSHAIVNGIVSDEENKEMMRWMLDFVAEPVEVDKTGKVSFENMKFFTLHKCEEDDANSFRRF